MNIVVVGLGSMGNRRIRHLKQLGLTVIFGVDTSEEKRTQAKTTHGIVAYATLDEAMTHKPDAVLICTPPGHHVLPAFAAIKNKLPFFTELNLITEEVRRISEGLSSDVTACAGADMRYIQSVQTMRKLVEEGRIGSIASIQYHVGQWLPDWHSGEVYTSSFLVKKETHACREIFATELKWLEWVFGRAISVIASRAKRTALKLLQHDTYHANFVLSSGALCSFAAEVVSRTPFRQLKAIGDKGTIVWDEQKNGLVLYDAETKSWTAINEEKGEKLKGAIFKEDPYVQELQHILDAFQGKREPTFSFKNELQLMHTLDAIEQSCETRKEEQISS